MLPESKSPPGPPSFVTVCGRSSLFVHVIVRAGLDGHVLRVERDVRDVDRHGVATAASAGGAAPVSVCSVVVVGRITSAVVIVVVAAGGDRERETCDEENEKLFHALAA